MKIRILIITTFLSTDVLCIPATGRSWEEEACAEQNIKGQDRYTCSEGKITCLPGWQGDLCQVPLCGSDCDPQHGYCTKPFECECNLGYSGDSCRECVKLPGCKNGFCRQSFECVCEDGWSGMFCNAPACPSSCNPATSSCVTPGVCTCNQGYGGENCTECATPEGCLHGTCENPGECNCEEGWQGKLCNEPICAQNCKGICRKPGTCECEVGWKGAECNECTEYPGCANGNCSEPWECNCKDGWSGDRCDTPSWGLEGWRPGKCIPLGAFLCMNGGTEVCNYWGNGSLVMDPFCTCPLGFSGEWCENEINLKEDEDKSESETSTLTIQESEGSELTSKENILKTEGITIINEDGDLKDIITEETKTRILINHTKKLENALEWAASKNRYTGSGRRTSK